jgi:hypothetical protein
MMNVPESRKRIPKIKRANKEIWNLADIDVAFCVASNVKVSNPIDESGLSSEFLIINL